LFFIGLIDNIHNNRPPVYPLAVMDVSSVFIIFLADIYYIHIGISRCENLYSNRYLIQL